MLLRFPGLIILCFRYVFDKVLWCVMRCIYVNLSKNISEAKTAAVLSGRTTCLLLHQKCYCWSGPTERNWSNHFIWRWEIWPNELHNCPHTAEFVLLFWLDSTSVLDLSWSYCRTKLKSVFWSFLIFFFERDRRSAAEMEPAAVCDEEHCSSPVLEA